MVRSILQRWGALALAAALIIGCAGADPRPQADVVIRPAETEEAAAWQPEEASPNHLALGQDLVRQGHYSVAMRQLTDSLATHADEPQPHTLLGVCHRETGNLSEAKRYFERAIALDEAYAPAHNGLGITLFMMGDEASARRIMGTAVSIDPANADYHNNLGMLEMHRNGLAAARSCFEQCLRITPDHTRAINNMAECLVRMGKDEEALALLRKHFLPETACNNLGAAYLKTGNTDKARQMFNKALAYDPELAEAQENLDTIK